MNSIRKQGQKCSNAYADPPLVYSAPEAKAAATTFPKSAELLEGAFEGIPLAIVVIANDGRIAMLNTQAETLFGYARGELLHCPVETLVPQRFRHGHPADRNKYFDSPRARAMGAGRELFGLHRNGSEFPVEIGLNPIKTDRGDMVISAIVDITERKQREEEMRTALREKDLLLGEIHHRVKNNLQIIHSLMDLQSMGTTDPKVLELLRDGQGRVRSMSLIHQTLYQSHDFANVDLKQFLESLLPVVFDSFGASTDFIHLHVKADGIRLPISSAIPCGLIINELVSNALKHAFPSRRDGNLSIELTQQGEDMLLCVSNDGVPIAPELDLDDLPTLGIRLVSLLAAQLGGALTIQKASPTRFSIRFPAS
ncbi:MAG: histidine kinase dimerization/phosphoacceptor domain -containing protein [Usitatibacteraceae bacterium]